MRGEDGAHWILVEVTIHVVVVSLNEVQYLIGPHPTHVCPHQNHISNIQAYYYT